MTNSHLRHLFPFFQYCHADPNPPFFHHSMYLNVNVTRWLSYFKSFSNSQCLPFIICLSQFFWLYLPPSWSTFLVPQIITRQEAVPQPPVFVLQHLPVQLGTGLSGYGQILPAYFLLESLSSRAISPITSTIRG